MDNQNLLNYEEEDQLTIINEWLKSQGVEEVEDTPVDPPYTPPPFPGKPRFPSAINGIENVQKTIQGASQKFNYNLLRGYPLQPYLTHKFGDSRNAYPTMNIKCTQVQSEIQAIHLSQKYYQIQEGLQKQSQTTDVSGSRNGYEVQESSGVQNYNGFHGVPGPQTAYQIQKSASARLQNCYGFQAIHGPQNPYAIQASSSVQNYYEIHGVPGTQNDYKIQETPGCQYYYGTHRVPGPPTPYRIKESFGVPNYYGIHGVPGPQKADQVQENASVHNNNKIEGFLGLQNSSQAGKVFYETGSSCVPLQPMSVTPPIPAAQIHSTPSSGINQRFYAVHKYKSGVQNAGGNYSNGKTAEFK